MNGVDGCAQLLDSRRFQHVRDFYRNEADPPVVPRAVLLFMPEAKVHC
jgi:hypothetical protein